MTGKKIQYHSKHVHTTLFITDSLMLQFEGNYFLTSLFFLFKNYSGVNIVYAYTCEIGDKSRKPFLSFISIRAYILRADLNHSTRYKCLMFVNPFYSNHLSFHEIL